MGEEGKEKLVKLGGNGVVGLGEYGKVAVCVAFCVLSMMANSVLLSMTHDLSVWNAVLPDAAFAAVPQQAWAIKGGDVACLFQALNLVLLMVVHKGGLVVARRITLLGGFMYGLRAVCLVFTTLPVSYEHPGTHCLNQTDEFHLGKMLGRAALSFFTFGSGSGGKIPCGDLFFSGHTILLTLGPLFAQLYLPSRLRLLAIAQWLITVFGMVCMVISRTHYSIDVIASFVITRAVFALLHILALLPHADRAGGLGSLSAVLTLAQWTEARTPFGAPPRALRWPCACPASLAAAFDAAFADAVDVADDATPVATPKALP